MANHNIGEGLLSAFPNTEETPFLLRGLTLRDYFAGQALIGILHDPDLLPYGRDMREGAAEMAYAIADAMIGARSHYHSE